MNRGKWVYRADESGQTEAVPYQEAKIEQSTMIITDELPANFRSMADRQIYTSKRKYRDSLRRLGKVEVGNASLAELEIKESKADKEAYEQQLEDDIAHSRNAVKYDEAPLDELDKERCKIINQSNKNRIAPRE